MQNTSKPTKITLTNTEFESLKDLKDLKQLKKLETANPSPKNQASSKTVSKNSFNHRFKPSLLEKLSSLMIDAQTLNTWFDGSLPVHKVLDSLEDALLKHQVLIISGETGSGKTTQLPKLVLKTMVQAYQNKNSQSIRLGLIGVTQPRRLAATSTAKRLSQELEPIIKDAVAYQVRMQHNLTDNTCIKVMTDGILLSEIAHDPLLKKYQCIVLDEAHERSLNIDFLLGYLKNILPQRPDLKLIVTSATIDTQSFSEHFNHAPIFKVEGRSYPVAIEYMDEDALANLTPLEQLAKAIDNLPNTGDILVFLPGEYDITEAMNYLQDKQKHLPTSQQAMLLPLYARLSSAQQQRIFKADALKQRIILATNVAETSITVPNIRYVIDAGLAKVKRYSYRQKIEQLMLEPASQASCNQRAGRCGRVAEGICIRLFSQQDFLNRPEHSQPEILRSSLAGVLLKMYRLGLGDIKQFKFIQPPNTKAISDAYQQLLELQAIETKQDSATGYALTTIGYQLSDWPIDINMARMLYASEQLNCSPAIAMIVAGLSIQDPKEYAPEAILKAKQAYAQFKHPQSEFISLIQLFLAFKKIYDTRENWKEVQTWCQKNFVSFMRMKEWYHLYQQLLELITQKQNKSSNTNQTTLSTATNENHLNKLEVLDKIEYANIHQALLTGLLGQIAYFDKEKNHYIGARQIAVHIHSQSALFKQKYKWIMAQSLQETHKINARMVAEIDAQWVVKQAAHLIKKRYSEGFWSVKHGASMCYEEATLYGLRLYSQKTTPLEAIDAKQARQLFIRALVEQSIDTNNPTLKQETHLSFFKHNTRRLQRLEQIEHRIRQNTLTLDDDIIFDLYEQKIPKHILNIKMLIAWLKQLPTSDKHCLHFTKQDFIAPQQASLYQTYPEVLRMNQYDFKLSYHFQPGYYWDGVTLTCPLWQLVYIDQSIIDWLVPGMLEEKVLLLLKQLPQRYRRLCVPLPNYAKAFIERTTFAQGQLLETLISDIAKHTNIKQVDELHTQLFNLEQLPTHLKMHIKLIDEHGAMHASSRDLHELKQQYNAQAKQAFNSQIKPLLKQAIEIQVDIRPNNAQKNQDNPQNKNNPKDEQAISTQINQSNQINHTTPLTDAQYTDWTFKQLPELLEIIKHKKQIIGYPALVAMDNFCQIDVFDEAWQAQIAHQAGVAKLIALQLKPQLKQLEKNIQSQLELCLQYHQMTGLDIQSLVKRLQNTCVYELFNLNYVENLPNTQDAFKELMQYKAHFLLRSETILKQTASLFSLLNSFYKRWQTLKQHKQPEYVEVYNDIKAQLDWLLLGGQLNQFNIHHAYAQRLPIYLQGIDLRLQRLGKNLDEQLNHMDTINQYKQNWLKEAKKRFGQQFNHLHAFSAHQAWWHFNYLIEDLKVHGYAPSLKLPQPTSSKRLDKVWQGLVYV